jgi:hypothetical protein
MKSNHLALGKRGMAKKAKGFKIGDIVKCNFQSINDVSEYDPYNDGTRLKKRSVTTQTDTLLILGHDGEKRFIVTPMGEYIPFSNRNYFTFGGFDKCFKLLVTYVNENCSLVS